MPEIKTAELCHNQKHRGKKTETFFLYANLRKPREKQICRAFFIWLPCLSSLSDSSVPGANDTTLLFAPKVNNMK